MLIRQFGMVPSLGIFYRDEDRALGQGMELLLEEARNTEFLLEKTDGIISLWPFGGYTRIWELCKNMVQASQPSHVLAPIQRSMICYPANSANKANTLAAVYFAYQLLTAEYST